VLERVAFDLAFAGGVDRQQSHAQPGYFEENKLRAGSGYTGCMSSQEGPAQVIRPLPDGAARKPRSSVAFSFGSPADDSGVGRIDLNDVLIRHAQATFLMRVAGSAMRETGIDDGDLVLVDRAIRPAHGHVVIAIVDDGFVCRRLVQQAQDVRLRAADASVADLLIAEGAELQVWGVVTHAIKSLPV
jgi:DNA polymerase V